MENSSIIYQNFTRKIEQQKKWESICPASEENEIQNRKIAMTALLCMRVVTNYRLIKKLNFRYKDEMQADLTEIVEGVYHLKGFHEISNEKFEKHFMDLAVIDVLDLLEIMGEVPKKMVLKTLAYSLEKELQVITQDVAYLINVFGEFFLQEGREDITVYLIQEFIKKSRKKNPHEQHREMVVRILANRVEQFPELACLVFQQEKEFFSEKDLYSSEYFAYYGRACVILEEYQKAKELWYQCWILRKEVFYDEYYYTMLAKREYDYLVWHTEKKQEALEELLRFVDYAEKKEYPDNEEKGMEILEGRTLYTVFMELRYAGGIAECERYMEIYERLCHKYREESEFALNIKFAEYIKSVYHAEKGSYMQAEQDLLKALQGEEVKKSKELTSDLGIKIDLLTLYFAQNDQEKAGELIKELLELLEQREQEFTVKHKYLIYTYGVFWEIMKQPDSDNLKQVKKKMKECCNLILKGGKEVGEAGKEISNFVMLTMKFLCSTGHIKRFELKRFFRIVSEIEKNLDEFGFYKNQRIAFYYIAAELKWRLEKEGVAYYIEKGMEEMKNSAPLLQLQLECYELAASYYSQYDRYDQGKIYIQQALENIAKVWRSSVCYLNDIRLIQILKPVQLTFGYCYSIFRDKESLKDSYERVLQYKALASLAGKERNRILLSGKTDEGILRQIQELQNKIAVLEAASIFRDDTKEYREETERLRKLEAAFADQFPENFLFTEISWGNVWRKMPDFSVLVEYFSCATRFGIVYDSEIQEEEYHGMDIYVTRKENGVCTLNRITVMEGMEIEKAVLEFVEILQAKSVKSEQISQMERMEELRMYLYRKLIEPVISELEGMETVYIAPDYTLVNLPFGILAGEDGEFLEEKYQIIEMECGRDFLYAGDGTEEHNGDGTLVIGNPEYLIRERKEEKERSGEERNLKLKEEGVKNLPFTKAEIQKIAQRKGVECYSENDATKYRFLEQKRFRNIHIATHGFFDLEEEKKTIYSSSLMFAGVNNWLQTGKISQTYGNGIVTADEISRMDLHGTQLAVLSSCLSGRSESLHNKGFHGMVGAFSAAGVKYVISHLWNANDFSTAIFMEAFYEEYMDRKQSPPVALRKAKEYMQKVTVRELKMKGWFDSEMKLKLTEDACRTLEEYEKYNDRRKPFAKEEFWGGFVCYYCN